MATERDGLWVDLTSSKEEDLDELHKIEEIRGIFYDDEDEKFYIVANKKHKKLGFFLTSYKCHDPKDYKDIVVLNNKLNIDDVFLKIVRGQDAVTRKPYKELVIGSKVIYQNTFQVTVQDLSKEQTNSTFARHESFHLWESKIFGLITSKNKDFITLSKDGMELLTLNPKEQRAVADSEG